MDKLFILNSGNYPKLYQNCKSYKKNKIRKF